MTGLAHDRLIMQVVLKYNMTQVDAIKTYNYKYCRHDDDAYMVETAAPTVTCLQYPTPPSV